MNPLFSSQSSSSSYQESYSNCFALIPIQGPEKFHFQVLSEEAAKSMPNVFRSFNDDIPIIFNAMISIYTNDFERGKFLAFYPFSHLLLLQVYSCLIKVEANKCTSIYETVKCKSNYEIHLKVSEALSKYLDRTNEREIIDFINMFIEGLKTQQDLFQIEVNHLKLYSEMLSMQRPDWMQQSPYQLGNFASNPNPKYFLSPQDHYRIAVRSFQYAYSSIFSFSRTYAGLIYNSAETLRFTNELDFAEFHNTLSTALWVNSFLKLKQKVAIGRLILEKINLFQSGFNNTRKTIRTNILGKESDGYFSKLASDAVERIVLDNQYHQMSPETVVYDPFYVKNNSVVYEEFLPHMDTILNVIKNNHYQLSESCEFLKNLHLYFCLGNVERLSFRMEHEPSTPVEKLLKEELRAFANQDLKQRIIDVIGLLNKFPNMKKWRDGLINFEMHSKKVLLHIQMDMDAPIAFAKERYNDLFILPVDHQPLTDTSIISPGISEIVINESIESTSSSSCYHAITETILTECIEPSSSSSSSSHAITSTEDYLEYSSPTDSTTSSNDQIDKTIKASNTIYFFLKREFASVHRISRSLKNSQNHLSALLYTISRLDREMHQPITSGQVHAFVVDIARHTTLATEQMLSALQLQCNGTQDAKITNPSSTHDLCLLLFLSKTSATSIPRRLRYWISQINRGEILVRDLKHCQIGRIDLETLLANTWNFVNGQSPIDPKNLISTALVFSQTTVELCAAVQQQLAPQGTTARIRKNIASQLVIASRKLHLELENRLNSSEFHSSSSPEDSPLRKVFLSFKELYDSQEIEHGFDNILNHLLLRLETEYNIPPVPKEIPFHFNNVLLHNQMIAEAALTEFILINGLHYSLVGQNRHDLFAMASLIGLQLTQEEASFLSSSKEIRQFVRYPASYGGGPLNPLMKQVRAMRVLAHQIASEKGTDADILTLQTFLKANTKLLEDIIIKLAEKFEPMAVAI